MSEEKKTQSAQKSKQKQSKSKRKKNRKQQVADHLQQSGDDLTLYQQTVQKFAACGRCSFFFVGYRVLVGLDAVKEDVKQQSDWLNLRWSHGMRDLVSRSYGVRLDVDHVRYEACCPECQRPFSYRQAGNGQATDSFRIQVS